MATTNDLKNGMVLNLDGQLWSVIWFQHHKPGKGGAVVRTKLKNVLSGKVVDKTFNADVRVEIANVDKRHDDATSTTTATSTCSWTPTPTSSSRVARDRRRRVALHAREPGGDRRHARGRRRSTSSCRRRSSCRSSTPSPACRATARPAAPSRPGSRPATRSPCRCSSPPARRSRSTPATAATSAASRVRQLMGARTKARKRALDILFESELRGLHARRARSAERAHGEAPALRSTTTRSRWSRAWSRTAPRSTRLIATYSAGWPLDRMPAVDRNILRIGVFELLLRRRGPDAVALSEAVALARELSTDESPAFVNGVLAKIASQPATPD